MDKQQFYRQARTDLPALWPAFGCSKSRETQKEMGESRVRVHVEYRLERLAGRTVLPLVE